MKFIQPYFDKGKFSKLTINNNNKDLNSTKLFENNNKLLEDIHDHQIELEMQNEALRRNQAELQNTQNDYIELYDFAPVGYCTLNKQNCIVKANLTLSDMLGVNRYHLVTMPLNKFITSDSQDIFNLGIIHLRKTGKKQWFELKLQKTDKKKIYVRMECVIKKDGSGHINVAIIDISEVKEANKKILILNKNLEQKVEQRTRELRRTMLSLKEKDIKLHQAEKMEAIGQLAGGIAHDFNNQLTGIRGYTEVLKEELKEKPKYIEYLNRVLKGVHRASELTKKLLAFARKGKYRIQELNIHTVILETISILEHCINKNITITHKFTKSQPVIFGDPSQLQNVILNIGLNARDAMTKGGELSFSTEIVYLDSEYCQKGTYCIQKGRYLLINITDNGMGMSKEVQKHIFEPFFTTKETGKGTGMGLAAVYGIIKNHKGYIDVTSKIGKGSKFQIYLPVTLKKNDSLNSTNTKISSDKTINKPKARILLVDDEKTVRDVSQELLVCSGYKVSVASNGKEAVDFYKENWKTIDVIILDMIMPEMDGREAYFKMRKINPNLKVILFSGYSLDNKTQNLLNQGVKAFIQKPFKFEFLYRKIEQVYNLN